MPACINCGQQTFGTNLCALCANTLPPGSPIWSQLKVDQGSKGTAPERVGTRRALTTVLQDANKIEDKSDSVLSKNMPDWVGFMCTFLDSRGYWNAKSESSVGDQNTPKNCTTGTTSLDFQGIRSGTEGTFWIDLQGQIGGGGTKRKSYCQALIQTCTGGPVPAELITAALLQSLKGGKKRAVIHVEGGTGMPK